jgi:4'-phosphopantetheinyl transferase
MTAVAATPNSPLPPLGVSDVHIWNASAAEHAPREAFLATLLDRDERSAAARLRFRADRTRYVVAHGLLRVLLAAYVDAAPHQLAFANGTWGKPSLRLAGAPLPEFNLSHAGDRILIAVAHRPVGIDIERWTDGFSYEELACSVFSAAECRELAAIEPARKRAAFFAGWTRKEAYVKAIGAGIGYGLAAFDVSLDPGRPARILADRTPSAAAHPRWTLESLPVDEGYSAAVVAAGTGWQTRMFALTPGDPA